VDLAIHNAGNNTAGRILEMEADYFGKSWRVCFGGFLFGREAPRRMVPRNRGAILFTGASDSLRGRAGCGAFNSAKAGLRIFAQAMAKEYGPEGIHVGHVVVNGAVNGDKIRRRFPDADSRRDRMLESRGVVECYAFLYRQPHKAWSFEVDARTSVKPW
jgi:NAD(P)-dependent dehydrogenase (short-subunit alcohol dehydrogenase family)